MNEIFHISKLIIKKRLKTLNDSESLELEVYLKKHLFLKEITIKELIDTIESYPLVDKEKAWKLIEVKVQKRKNRPVFELFKRPWRNVSAAAIFVGLLATVYFFNNDVVNSSFEKDSIIVKENSNVILPGTNKATLTLEDGSVIILEKNITFQTSNANSNGEHIVYNPGKTKSEKVVYNYLTIPRGGQFYIILSDGTKVWLNSESQLKYPVAFNDGETRQVDLVYGEAYFDVSPSTEHNGSSFKVLNNSQEVEVLGTEFNIKAYRDETNIYTTLVEGKVVIDNGVLKQNLEPNQQLKLNTQDNNFVVSEVDVKDEISWRDGKLSFNNESLKDIMKIISRWYDVDVVFKTKELETAEFIGVLDKQQSIEEVLSILKSTTIENYEITNDTIILE
ncbi:FecR family protein [Flavicella sediminum]|uniref:FecR family protein n=1 Tax=Flavicella sediminum TaxID=2585141 RepID=UPI0011210FD2|nr:FecR family protein [Flavicella sediminum]